VTDEFAGQPAPGGLRSPVAGVAAVLVERLGSRVALGSSDGPPSAAPAACDQDLTALPPLTVEVPEI
jgi:hypothetical protein